jgi:hypothetical protein
MLGRTRSWWSFIHCWTNHSWPHPPTDGVLACRIKYADIVAALHEAAGKRDQLVFAASVLSWTENSRPMVGISWLT